MLPDDGDFTELSRCLESRAAHGELGWAGLSSDPELCSRAGSG